MKLSTKIALTTLTVTTAVNVVAQLRVVKTYKESLENSSEEVIGTVAVNGNTNNIISVKKVHSVLGMKGGAGFNGDLLLGEALLQADKNLLKAVMTHELQHAVQTYEGRVDNFKYSYDVSYRNKIEAEADKAVIKYCSLDEIKALIAWRAKLSGLTLSNPLNYNNINLCILIKGYYDRVSGKVQQEPYPHDIIWY